MTGLRGNVFGRYSSGATGTQKRVSCGLHLWPNGVAVLSNWALLVVIEPPNKKGTWLDFPTFQFQVAGPSARAAQGCPSHREWRVWGRKHCLPAVPNLRIKLERCQGKSCQTGNRQSQSKDGTNVQVLKETEGCQNIPLSRVRFVI